MYDISIILKKKHPELSVFKWVRDPAWVEFGGDKPVFPDLSEIDTYENFLAYAQGGTADEWGSFLKTPVESTDEFILDKTPGEQNQILYSRGSGLAPLWKTLSIPFLEISLTNQDDLNDSLSGIRLIFGTHRQKDFTDYSVNTDSLNLSQGEYLLIASLDLYSKKRRVNNGIKIEIDGEIRYSRALPGFIWGSNGHNETGVTYIQVISISQNSSNLSVLINRLAASGDVELVGNNSHITLLKIG